MIQKTPPNDIEAEKAVLGSMLLNANTIPQGVSELHSAVFYQNRHQHIFDAISSLYRNGENVDLVTVVSQLNREGKLDESGGAAYIAELTSGIISSSINSYVKIIKEKASARHYINISQRIVNDCYAGQPIESIINLAGSEFLKAAKSDSMKAAKISDISDRVMNRLNSIESGEVDPMGLPTGFYDLDNILNGLQKSDLIIIAGRPSMGKTTVGMNIIISAAQKGHRTLIFSLEMSKDRLIQNQLAAISGVSNLVIQRADFKGHTRSKINDAHHKLSALPIRIDDSAALHISQIQAIAKTFAMVEGVDLILVDYLQLIKGSDKVSRDREVAEISAGLKALAKDLDIPVIALSQLSRKCEGRTDKRPLMSDLRDSGSIEQDADVILFIYRDEVYNPDINNPLRGVAELIVGKNRCGSQGKVKLNFDGEKCRFTNLLKTGCCYREKNSGKMMTEGQIIEGNLISSLAL